MNTEDNNAQEHEYADQNGNFGTGARSTGAGRSGAGSSGGDHTGDDDEFTNLDEGYRDADDETDNDDDYEDENDEYDFDALCEMSYEELSGILPGGQDEAFEVACKMAERTLDLLYRLREEDPETDIDGEKIDDLIVKLEEHIARSKEVQLELEAVLKKMTDCFAKMCLEKANFPSPFWSFAATVGRCRYPAHPQVQSYFDLDDLREYLRNSEPNPIHLLN